MSAGIAGIELDCAAITGFSFVETSEVCEHVAKIGVPIRFVRHQLQGLAQGCFGSLELAKPALNGADPAAATRTRQVLGYVLDQLLRLIHPVMPFVTEALWAALTGGSSIMIAQWPGALAPALPGRLESRRRSTVESPRAGEGGQ